MKYYMLSQWVKENSNPTLAVDKITDCSPLLEISFKNDKKLVCYYKSPSPFPFFDTIDAPGDAIGNSLWQQLHKTELYRIDLFEADRIILFFLKLKDIYQQITEYRLVFECMPPQGNLILCKQDDGKMMITDALNKFSFADNPKRQILPGMEYQPPRTGFTPQLEKIEYPLKISAGNESIYCDNINDYFSSYYNLVVKQAETAQKKAKLLAYWNKELCKAEYKLSKQQAEADEAELEALWLTYAETIKTNLAQIKRGDETLAATNYYDPELKKITIPLLTDKSPQENLKLYLKKYRKAKKGREKIKLQIKKTLRNIQDIRDILNSFASEEWQNLAAKAETSARSIGRLEQAETLFRIKVNEDWEIVIGRKAKENDFISTQLGKPDDWWFHTRIYRGSHILLRNFSKKIPPLYLVELCCSLAAWFSKAKNSENVPVDYTQIRYVRKPRKSAPGLVTYTNHKTVFVNPLDVNSAKEIISRHAG